MRDRLLQSNPVRGEDSSPWGWEGQGEATRPGPFLGLWHAKTLRNDSSRFGRYMDVQFDFKVPMGGAGQGEWDSHVVGTHWPGSLAPANIY